MVRRQSTLCVMTSATQQCPYHTQAIQVLRKGGRGVKEMDQLVKHDPQTGPQELRAAAGHSPTLRRHRQADPGAHWTGGPAELVSSQFKELVFKNTVESKGGTPEVVSWPPHTCTPKHRYTKGRAGWGGDTTDSSQRIRHRWHKHVPTGADQEQESVRLWRQGSPLLPPLRTSAGTPLGKSQCHQKSHFQEYTQEKRKHMSCRDLCVNVTVTLLRKVPRKPSTGAYTLMVPALGGCCRILSAGKKALKREPPHHTTEQ